MSSSAHAMVCVPHFSSAAFAALDMPERVAQHFDVDAVALRKREALVVRDQASPHDQVVDRLRHLRRADLACVHDVRRISLAAPA